MTRRLAACVGLLVAGLSLEAGAATEAEKNAAPQKPRPRSAPRTLDPIHIEGEIPVPQVLFITARDQRRFLDFHHGRYLRTSLELGETTVFPTCIAVIRNQPTDARKEPSP